MAYAFATVAPASLFPAGSRALLRNNVQKVPVSILTGRQKYFPVLAQAVGDQSDSSSQTSIVKVVQDAFNDSEDRIPLLGLGFAAIVAIWASSNLITAIDKLPLVPTALELVGILFSWWFVYRYLLFKPDREELVKIINSLISAVLGQ